MIISGGTYPEYHNLHLALFISIQYILTMRRLTRTGRGEVGVLVCRLEPPCFGIFMSAECAGFVNQYSGAFVCVSLTMYFHVYELVYV